MTEQNQPSSVNKLTPEQAQQQFADEQLLQTTSLDVIFGMLSLPLQRMLLEKVSTYAHLERVGKPFNQMNEEELKTEFSERKGSLRPDELSEFLPKFHAIAKAEHVVERLKVRNNGQQG